MFVSDHGEMLGERGLRGHGLLEKEVYTVPFIYYSNKQNSFLNNKEFFWSDLCFDWSALLDHYLSKNYRIKFSKYPIENWIVIKLKNYFK